MEEFTNEELLLTKEGYDKIVAEHDELVSVKRAEVAERIKEAISYGDISENAEYDSAKNEQAELEERIRQLEQKALKKLERAIHQKKGISYEIGRGIKADKERHQRAKMRREA